MDTQLLRRINRLELQLERFTREGSGAERTALEVAQTRADSVAALFGQTASAPVPGETALDYRKRLATGFAAHSPALKDSRLLGALDSGTFALVEERIYNDAVAAAHAAPGHGTLKAIESRDAAGRLVTRYAGDISAFMAPFTASGVAAKLNRPGK